MFEMISQRKYQTAVKNLVGEGGYKILRQRGGPVLAEGLNFVEGVSTLLHAIKLAKLNTSSMKTFLKIW